MKQLALIYFLSFLPFQLQATPQEPDILVYKHQKLMLAVGWGHPAPLDTYYHQENISSPFHSLGTGNYRGYVASWTIRKGKLYLTQVSVEDTIYKPKDVAVFEDCSTAILPANWFTGMIRVYKFNLHSGKGREYEILFHIHKGNVIQKATYGEKKWDKYMLSDTENVPNNSRTILFKMHENYVAFYYRLRTEEIVLNGSLCRLQAGFRKLSPIFQYFENRISGWPYNWENIVKSGAPFSSWEIKNDSLFLRGLYLHSGTAFSGPDREQLSISEEISDGEILNAGFGKKIHGVFLIDQGYFPEGEHPTKYYDFVVTGHLLIKVEAGIITESYSLPKYFQKEMPSTDFAPPVQKLLEAY